MAVSSFSPQNLDLFAEHAGGTNDAFEGAWGTWLANERAAGRLQLASSVAVYGTMWTALASWCIENRVELDRLSAADLDRFLRSRGGHDEISDRHGWRFLRLVDRVLSFSATHDSSSRSQSPAAELLEQRAELRFANGVDKDPLPEFLDAGEAKHLVTYLSAVRPGRAAADQAWQEVRNRAAVALMLGAGITPGEVRALETSHVFVDGGRTKGTPWKLRVAGHASSPARETPIASWAGRLLAYWLSIRAEQKVPGDVLFPSTRSGKTWSKVSQYDATKKVLRAAGVDDVEGGSFRLRHTFALRQLRRRKSPAEIARWLGVTDPAVMARYQRVLPAPVDVV